MASVTKILFVSADPSDAARLRLGEEMREVRQGLQLSKQRERFELAERHCVRPADLTQAIFDTEPDIIHFSGHGSATGSILLEDKQGNAFPISPDALEAVFELFSSKVFCVVLNACHSGAQAEAIARKIPYVVGMRDRIGDPAAITFSVGFYRALMNQRSIEDAFRFGLAELRLAGIGEHSTPVLITNSNVRRRLIVQDSIMRNWAGYGYEKDPMMTGRAWIRVTSRAQSPGTYALVDPAAYDTIAALLDELYLKLLTKKFPPYTYGEKWLLLAGDRFRQSVLAPVIWVASNNQPIGKIAPEWRQHTPESLGLAAGSGWSVHTLSKKQSFVGVATNSDSIYTRCEHPKGIYGIDDETVSIPLETINDGYDLSIYKYTRVILDFWTGHRSQRKILVDRRDTRPTSE